MTDVTMKAMPKYKCHEEVWALKIAGIRMNEDGSAVFIPEEDFAEIALDSAYMEKHQPKVNGYYVVYKDGYKSYSPGDVFEDGYTAIT